MHWLHYTSNTQQGILEYQNFDELQKMYLNLCFGEFNFSALCLVIIITVILAKAAKLAKLSPTTITCYTVVTLGRL